MSLVNELSSDVAVALLARNKDDGDVGASLKIALELHASLREHARALRAGRLSRIARKLLPSPTAEKKAASSGR